VNLLVVEDAEALAEAAAERIAAEAAAAAIARGACSLALSGGRTPLPAYRLLAEARLASRFPWSQTEFFFADERRVPPNDPRSNYAAARAALFSWAGMPAARIHRVAAEGEDPEAAALIYEEGLPERLDLMVLGVGEDGHVASLFPESTALRERKRRFVFVRVAGAVPERFTVTPPEIEAARSLLVLAAGASKAGAVARALEGEEEVDRVPARLARRGLWILDRAAAARLRASAAKEGT
jgi:6-phosphogluconolactonase